MIKDDGKKKPAITEFHDFRKEGKDVDQKIENHSMKPKSSKWTVSGENVQVIISDDSK